MTSSGTVLVTGGAGCIGSHTVWALRARKRADSKRWRESYSHGYAGKRHD